MLEYDWNKDKNKWLREHRYVGFEDIVKAIQSGDVLALVDHPNLARYPNQRVIVVAINGYAYEVPFVVSNGKIFFKTIIPSRRATKKYMSKG